jgi:hypothetical protein
MPRYFLFAGLALTCAPAWGNFINQVLDDNPAAFWVLNDVSGPTTTATDSSGNNFDGTYGSGVTPQGIAGPSWLPPSSLVANFTGGTITFPTPLDLGINGYTIEAWIDPDILSLTQTTRIVASGSGLNGYGFGTASGGRLIFTAFTQQDYFTTGLTLLPNQWQYVGVVLDSNNNANFYLNGSFVESVAGTLPTTAPTGAFTIGNHSPSVPSFPDEIYTGGAAGISVYKTALTSAQIQAQFDAAQADSSVPEPGTMMLIGSPLLFLALLVRHRKCDHIET